MSETSAADAAGFASRSDLSEKTISFTEIGRDLWAFTAEGDPNSGVAIGEESIMVIEAQATPRLARKVIEKIREVSDKPIRYLVLTHYHAVRVLGASAYEGATTIMSDAARGMVEERGAEDWASEFQRFPRLFAGHEEIVGLTRPAASFSGRMSVDLGRRRVELAQIGRGHTAGDIIAYVPDSAVMFGGDAVEHRSACYCGDAYFGEWLRTLSGLSDYDVEALTPGRGDALVGRDRVAEAMSLTEEFLRATYAPAARTAARGGTLKEAWLACRDACDSRFSDYAIYEHCLPFNVSRAYDEARGIETPRVWTAERDLELWRALRGE